MFCRKCGKTLPDDSKFCRYCGAPVHAGATKPPAVQQPVSAVIPERKAPQAAQQTVPDPVTGHKGPPATQQSVSAVVPERKAPQAAQQAVSGAEIKRPPVSQQTIPGTLPYGYEIISGQSICLADIVRTNKADKINAIKVLRDKTGLSLHDAKCIMEDAYKKYQAGPAQAHQPEKGKITAEGKTHTVAWCPKCGSTFPVPNMQGKVACIHCGNRFTAGK